MHLQRPLSRRACRRLCDGGLQAAAGGAPAEDVVRNVYDVLRSAPAVFATVDASGEAPSWCGWEQEAAAAPATGRKRAAPAAAPPVAASTPRWADAASQRRVFSEAWLSFLRMELPMDIYKVRVVGTARATPTAELTSALHSRLQKVLAQLHVAVVPALTNPLLLSDFLTRAVNLGAMLGMLALNGLFLLMTQHGLEYPQFYVRLYGASLAARLRAPAAAPDTLPCPPRPAGLLEPGVFHARHRRQFFELLDVFLRSTHLPAYLAAAFAKRLARLALSAPPHGAMLAIGFAHNLLRRHPGCLVLVQRARPAPGAAGAAGADPFMPDEADPARCRALESSLWELDALRQHYAPAVSRLVALLERDMANKLQSADVDVAALAGATYASLFAEDAERRLKAVPLAFYADDEQQPRALWDDSWLPTAAARS